MKAKVSLFKTIEHCHINYGRDFAIWLNSAILIRLSQSLCMPEPTLICRIRLFDRPTVFQGFTDIRTFVSELVRQADAPQRLPGMGIQRKKSGAIPDF